LASTKYRSIDRVLLGNLPPTLEWIGDDAGVLRLIDQTKLPQSLEMRDCQSAEDVWDAIKVLAVRGAPAIGVAAAYGMCLGLRPHRDADAVTFAAQLDKVGEYLCAARPTAVNLAWAVRRVSNVCRAHAAAGPRAAWSAMLAESHEMALEDAEMCRRIGEHGADLVPQGGGVLTHCNAGSLATVAYGTALAVLYVAHQRGRKFRVFADETRPLLQGARLTSYELHAAGLDVSVLCDNAAASLMKFGQIQMVITGADRIAANGDAANKIGTYGVAILAKHHNIPFYIAAPLSTFDLSIATGDDIPIEQRDRMEVAEFGARPTVPEGVPCCNPAFDVTPADLIAGIICERGIVKPVSAAAIHEISRTPA